MQIRLLSVLSLVLGIVFFSSCKKNEPVPGGNQNVESTFNQMFPNATQVEWETKSDYWIADFRHDGTDKTAWFESNGIWKMTESDETFNRLPEIVKNAFKAGEYSSWRVEDVDILDRLNYERLFVIEIEQGESEADLFYTNTGSLVKIEFDSNDDDYFNQLPTSIASGIETFIQTRYPGATIVEIDQEDNMIEVEILFEMSKVEVYFDQAENWLHSSRDVSYQQVIQTVKDMLATTEYASWHIDDIDFIEVPEYNFYKFELEQGNQEVTVQIKEDGTFLNDPVNPPTHPAIEEWIQNRYPNAQILEIEQENGMTKVEILFENIEIDVYFDGNDTWIRSERDVLQNQVPAVVMTTLQNSEYANFQIDDIDFIEILDYNFYQFELEQNDHDLIVKIREDGTFIDGDPINPPTNPTIEEWIQNRYPNAQIVEIEQENGMTKVEILFNYVEIEVYFDGNQAWLFSQRDVLQHDVSEVVMQALNASTYNMWLIDDIEFFETPEYNYYEFELESGEQEHIMKIKEDGTIF
ncbi:MAG: PepSY-like domain-containing protein [Bacteroidales bacterium]|nr:PepSY-like domain-containing protein [Bacteroidales bacterium]